MTRDSRRQLLMETLIGSLQIALGLYTATYWKEEEEKKTASCTSSPLCSLHCCSSRKPKALLSCALLQEQIKIRRLLTVSRPVSVAAPGPRNTSPSGCSSRAVRCKVKWPVGPPDMVKRTKAPLMPIRSSPLLSRGGRLYAAALPFA